MLLLKRASRCIEATTTAVEYNGLSVLVDSIDELATTKGPWVLFTSVWARRGWHIQLRR